MARKANIIKHLKMMGYSVGEDSGIYSIALQTGKGHIIAIIKTEEDLTFKDCIIEEIVREINDIISEVF